MMSPRYAGVVAVLLALAMVPTVIHSYRGATVADGLTAAAVPRVIDGMGSYATPRRAEWVKNNFESDDWIERIYRADNLDVTVFVGRSFDAKRLYHHPELALLRGTETTPADTVWSESRHDIPLHVLKTSKDRQPGVAVYALLSDGEFIENPVAFQLRTSARLLISGRKPLTLFMASDHAGEARHPEESAAARVLLKVIAAFEAQSAALGRR